MGSGGFIPVPPGDHDPLPPVADVGIRVDRAGRYMLRIAGITVAKFVGTGGRRITISNQNEGVGFDLTLPYTFPAMWLVSMAAPFGWINNDGGGDTFEIGATTFSGATTLGGIWIDYLLDLRAGDVVSFHDNIKSYVSIQGMGAGAVELRNITLLRAEMAPVLFTAV